MDTSNRNSLKGNTVNDESVSTDYSTASIRKRQSEEKEEMSGEKEDEGEVELQVAWKQNGNDDLEKQTLQVSDPNIVDWEGPADPEYPMNWSLKRKWGIISLVSAVTFNT
jgi:hypothetical protein